MKKSLIFSILCVCAGVVFAEETTSAQAIAAAQAWAADNASAFGSIGDPTEAEAQRDSDGSLLWWTVKTANGGAVIVAPDSEVEPIISVLPHYSGSIPAASPLWALLSRDVPSRVASIAADRATNSAKTVSTPVARAAVKAAGKWTRLTKRGKLLQSRKLSSRSLGNSSIGLEEESKTIRDPNLPPTVIRIVDGFEFKGRYTHWNQDKCCGWPTWPNYFTNPVVYNLYTPGNWVCGCAATALAAGLQFFDVTPWPEDSVTGECSVNGVPVKLTTVDLSEDFGGGSESGGEISLEIETGSEGEGEAAASCWSILPPELGGTGEWAAPNVLSELQVKLLGAAAYNAGVTISMEYSPEGSSATMEAVASAYRSIFGFKDGRCAYDYGNGGIDASCFDKLIHNQIRCGVPVLLGINGTPGGHAVLAVGYGFDADDTPLTRIFLGWSGCNDAWYNLPTVDCYIDSTGKSTESKYTVINTVLTMIATNFASLAVCGSAQTADGTAITNNARVVFPDGVRVTPDKNGYWARRTNPGAFRNDDIVWLEIFDSPESADSGDSAAQTLADAKAAVATAEQAYADADDDGKDAAQQTLDDARQALSNAGDAYDALLIGRQRAQVKVGANGLTAGTKETGYNFRATDLAADLPAAIDFRVYGSGALEVASTPESAQTFALETGKAILMVSGTDGNAQYDAIMAYVEEHADELAEDFVLYLVEASEADLSLLPDGDPSFGVFDPERFNAQAENLWSWYNGRIAYNFIPKASSSVEVVGHKPDTGDEITETVVYDPELTDEEAVEAFETVVEVGAKRWNATVSGSQLTVFGQKYWYTGFESEDRDSAWDDIGTVSPAYADYDNPYVNVYTDGETVVARAPAFVTNVTEGVVYACNGWYIWDDDVAQYVQTGYVNKVSFKIHDSESLALVWRWVPVAVKVDVSTGGNHNGKGTVSPESGWYPYGKTCIFSAKPNDGSQFDNWVSGDGRDILNTQITWHESDTAFANDGPAFSFTLLGDAGISLQAYFTGNFKTNSVPRHTLRINNASDSAGTAFPSSRIPSSSVFGNTVPYSKNVSFPEQKIAAVLSTNAFTDITGTTNWFLSCWTLVYDGSTVTNRSTAAVVNVNLTTNATVVLHWKNDSDPIPTSFDIAWSATFDNLHTNYTTNLLSGPQYQSLLNEGKDVDDLEISVPTGWKALTAASPSAGVTVVLKMDEDALKPSADALTITPQADGTLKVTADVSNGVAGFWYALYATDAIGGTWTKVAAGTSDVTVLQPKSNGTVTLEVSLDTSNPSVADKQFYKLVVSDLEPPDTL